MSGIIRHEVNEEWAYSDIVEAGDFVSLFLLCKALL